MHDREGVGARHHLRFEVFVLAWSSSIMSRILVVASMDVEVSIVDSVVRCARARSSLLRISERVASR